MCQNRIRRGVWKNGKLRKPPVTERRRNIPRFNSAPKQLTRYTSDKDRPLSTSRMTRYTQEYTRDEAEEGPAPHPAANLRTEALPPPSSKCRLTSEQSQPQAQKESAPLPRTEVVQTPEKQIVRSTQADLYSDAPITINVLKRALPQRFAEAKTSNTLGFKNAHTKNSQLGLTHGIRPLKSLFPQNSY